MEDNEGEQGIRAEEEKDRDGDGYLLSDLEGVY